MPQCDGGTQVAINKHVALGVGVVGLLSGVALLVCAIAEIFFPFPSRAATFGFVFSFLQPGIYGIVAYKHPTYRWVKGLFFVAAIQTPIEFLVFIGQLVRIIFVVGFRSPVQGTNGVVLESIAALLYSELCFIFVGTICSAVLLLLSGLSAKGVSQCSGEQETTKA